MWDACISTSQKLRTFEINYLALAEALRFCQKFSNIFTFDEYVPIIEWSLALSMA